MARRPEVRNRSMARAAQSDSPPSVAAVPSKSVARARYLINSELSRPVPLCSTLVDGRQPPGLNAAIGPSLQVRVQTFPVVGRHSAGAIGRHPLFGAPVQQGGTKFLLRASLQRHEEGGASQALLRSARAASTCKRSPGLPAGQRLCVDLVAILDRVLLGSPYRYVCQHEEQEKRVCFEVPH